MKTLTEPVMQLVRGRLWPVALLLVVAVVAAPLVLADREELPPAVTSTPVTGAQALQAAIVNAAQTDPGERRRVLGASKDPFTPTGKQPRARRTASVQAVAGADATGGATTSAPSGPGLPAGDPTDGLSPKPTVSTGGGSGAGAGGGTSTPGGGAPPPVSTVPAPTTGPATPKPAGPALYSLTVNVDGERRTLDRLDPLPSAESPAAIYLGVLEDGKTAVFLLDAGVKADGDGSCRPSPGDCQRVYLKKGDTEFFDIEGEDAEGGTGPTQIQVDLLGINVRKAGGEKAAGASLKRVSRSGRSLLRERVNRVGRLRYDADTGRLRLLTVKGWRAALAKARR